MLQEGHHPALRPLRQNQNTEKDFCLRSKILISIGIQTDWIHLPRHWLFARVRKEWIREVPSLFMSLYDQGSPMDIGVWSCRLNQKAMQIFVCKYFDANSCMQIFGCRYMYTCRCVQICVLYADILKQIFFCNQGRHWCIKTNVSECVMTIKTLHWFHEPTSSRSCLQRQGR